MAYQHHVHHGRPLTRESFTTPPLDMGIVPFWFWNGDLDYDEMEWQLRQYYDRGVRSLFIHGRMGLAVPYLSDGWFERVAFVVEKAKAIGLDAWIYDEMDWPSGTAEQQVLQADPDLSQRYLELVPLRFQGPIFTFLEAHDDRYVNTGNANPIAAYGVEQAQYDTVIEEVVDLNKNLAWEKTIPWEAPAGNWVLMYFLEKQAPYYIDTLNPASTETFIELTHERYRRTVGDAFGKTVPGFFTDEPAMYYYHVGLKNHVVPWSKQMFKIFRERRGYDLKPFLPALYRDMGEQTVQVRYDFWRTLTEQYAETYYKRLRDWCEANDLIFTGHLLFEEHLRLAARCEGNIFKYLQHLHLTGVDHLYPKIGTRDDPSQHVALKLGSSAAHHFGSPRLLCESMGGTYWDCTLERMKWMMGWEYVLGVNLFNNHGYHYTIEGERKRDWPPSQFYHHTWWKYYDRFTAYNARLSHLLTGGRHVAKVLMLYPINSIWTNYMPQETTPVGDVIERDFQYLTDRLLRLHVDFDYVDEDVLAGATVEDGTITIGEETYESVILPPVTHIKETTYDQLHRFLDGGGCVIADTLVPVGLLEAARRDSGGVVPLDDFFGIDGPAVLHRFEQGEAASFAVHQAGGHLYWFEGDGLHRDPDRAREAALRDLLHTCLTPDVTISDEHVFYLHREKDGFDLYFLVNTTQEDRGRVTVSFERVARPELWNPNTGETQPLHVFRIDAGRLVVELDFPPSEAHVVVLRGAVDRPHVTASSLDVTAFDGTTVVGYARGDAPPAATIADEDGERAVRAEPKPTRVPLPLPDRYDFAIDQPNVLVIEHWKMHLEADGDAPAVLAAPTFDDGDWLDVTNGAWEMQLPTERDEAIYPVALWYRTHFDADVVPDDLRLLIDGFSGSEHRLFINGEAVTDAGVRSWLDAEMREVDIAPFVQTGRNTVAVRLVVTRRTDGMLDLLKIVGDFALAGSAEDGWRIAARPPDLAVGDWTVQGYPFFSGTGRYRTAIDVPAAYLDGGRLLLEADCGEDVLEVRINGSAGRVAPWHPYRLDVTDLLTEGRNVIEIDVTNTLINILEGTSKPSGLFSPPRLIHQHRYELA